MILARCLNNMTDITEWLAQMQPDTEQESNTRQKKTHTLDLFNDILPALDRGDMKYYSRLSEDEKKAVSPWILMRWMTSSQNDSGQPAGLIAVNNLVNHNFSHLGAKASAGRQGHAELQWMLLAMCGSGSVRRKFLKPGRGQTKNKLETALTKFYPGLKTHEMELLLKMNSREQLAEFFKDNGYDDKNIEEILN